MSWLVLTRLCQKVLMSCGIDQVMSEGVDELVGIDQVMSEGVDELVGIDQVMSEGVDELWY